MTERIRVRRHPGRKYPWYVTGGPLIKAKVYPTWRQAQDAADDYATGRRAP